MESLHQHLFAEGFLTWREVLRLVLLSGVFTALCIKAFPNNAPSRRILLLAAVVLLAVLPWLLASVEAVWFFEASTLPPLTLASAVPNLLIWGWLSVAAAAIFMHVRSLVQELGTLNALPDLDDRRIGEMVTQLSERLEMPVPRIVRGGHACATSLGQPLLVLPAEHVGWDDATLRGVLAHELVHLKRRDDRWMLLTRLMVLIYWWMPWLMWLYRGYVRVMEESCDDAAAELAGLDLRYVEALADAAGARRSARALELPAMHEHHLVGRVGRFARARALELDTGGVYWAVVGILLAVTALTGIEPRLPEPVYRSAPADFSYQSVAASNPGITIPSVIEHVEVPPGTASIQRQRLDQPSYAPPVIYPGGALRAGVEGEVVVEFAISHDGSVSAARVVESQPPGVFDTAALRAVKNTRYLSRYRNSFPTTTGASQALRDSERPPGETPRVRRHFRFRLNAE